MQKVSKRNHDFENDSSAIPGPPTPLPLPTHPNYALVTVLITWIKKYRPRNSDLGGCCEAVWLDEVFPPFQKYEVFICKSPLPLNIEARRSFETSGTTQPMTRHHFPEDLKPQKQGCEKLKPRRYRSELLNPEPNSAQTLSCASTLSR